MIHAEIAEDAAVEAEAGFARIPVVHPLPPGVVRRLTGVLVFQLEGEDRDSVEHKNHIHALLRIRAVIPLPVHVDPVGSILRGGGPIEGGFRLEITDAERNAAVPEAVTQHRKKPVHIAGVVEGEAELPLRVVFVHRLEPRPLLRLGTPDEIDKSVRVQCEGRVVDVRPLRVPARGREQRGLYVGFKAFFGGVHLLFSRFLFLGTRFFSVVIITKLNFSFFKQFF